MVSEKIISKYKIDLRLTKYSKDKKKTITQELKADLASSEEARATIQAETQYDLLVSQSEEIRAKLEAIKSLAKAQRKAAFTALIDQEQADEFFANNPITIKAPYFFSAMDSGLLITTLGVSKDQLLKKLKKGEDELISFINETLDKKLKQLAKKKRAGQLEQEVQPKMRNSVLTQIELRLGLASRILRNRGTEEGLTTDRDGHLITRTAEAIHADESDLEEETDHEADAE